MSLSSKTVQLFLQRSGNSRVDFGLKSDMLGALNQKVAIMLSDLNFKVDKDNLQQDLDEKLDKVLEAVLAIQLQQAADNAVKDKAEKAKKMEK